MAKTDVLIFDYKHHQRRDLFEIIEDRYERRSTIITSQRRWIAGKKRPQNYAVRC